VLRTAHLIYVILSNTLPIMHHSITSTLSKELHTLLLIYFLVYILSKSIGIITVCPQKIILMKLFSTFSQMKCYQVSICLAKTLEEGFSAMKFSTVFSVLTMIGSFTKIPRLIRRQYTNLISFATSDIAKYSASISKT
jgi:hypothetical protein